MAGLSCKDCACLVVGIYHVTVEWLRVTRTRGSKRGSPSRGGIYLQLTIFTLICWFPVNKKKQY